MIIGFIAALFAAFSWTVACFIWRLEVRHLSAIQLNLFKNSFATLLFSPVIFIIDWTSEISFIGLLFLSGVVGIALGDSFYLSALKRLGTRRTLTVEAFSPILANFLGTFLIGEHFSFNSLLGAFMVTTALVLLAKQKISNVDNHTQKSVGLIFAFLSVLCAVCAATISRYVLTNSSFTPLETTEIRLIAAIIILMPLCRIHFFELLKTISKESINKLFIATLLGTNLGILLQQIVFQSMPIGIGWTLLSTSPIFSLFLARFEGETISRQTILISSLAFLGVGVALF